MAGLETITSGVNFSGWTGGLSIFVKWLFWPLLIAGMMWGVWWLISYNVRVIVHKPGGIGDKDKGKRTRDKATRQIKGFAMLKYKKDYSGAPIDEHLFIPVKKMFGRIGYELHMIIDEKGNLYPLLPPQAHDIPKWKGISGADISWHLSEIQRAEDRYLKKSNFLSFLAQAAPYIGLAIVVILMIVFFKQMEGITAGLQSIATQLQSTNTAVQII